MLTYRTSDNSFPSVCIAKDAGRTLLEVHLIADIGRGQGNKIVQQAADLQRHHPRFVDALDEPSTCIGELPQSEMDNSSLYTFLVECQGHPLHRHASSRMFTAVSGGDGTQLRFSTANLAELGLNLDAFFEQAYCIQIPADCLFSVRFVGGVWHQFVPGSINSTSPALFAVSCHPDDLSGIQDQSLRNQVLAGEANIPMLTEVLPEQLSHAIAEQNFAARCAKFQQLKFHQGSVSHVEISIPSLVSQLKTSCSRLLTRLLHRHLPYPNQGTRSLFSRAKQRPVPLHSLVWNQLKEKKSYHLDHFELVVLCKELRSFRRQDATWYMSELLQAFIEDSPASVSCLMQLRNMLVKPFGLRTSHIGCPVSSLLSDQAQEYFLGRFPVWTQQVNADNTRVQVVLGADDKHLQFRSVVMVEIKEEGIVISLTNRVAYRNFFGQFYMGCIQGVHKAFIVPKMLSTAARTLCQHKPKDEVPKCWCMRLLLG